LRAALLMNQLEIELFVQVPGGGKSCESPEVHPNVTAKPAKFHGGFQQARTEAGAACFVRGNEPSQMGALALCVQPVYRERTLNSTHVDAQPETIALVIVPLAERGQLPCNLGFEGDAESRLLAVVVRMQFGYSPDTTWG